MRKTKPFQARQGDVLIESCEPPWGLPSWGLPSTKGRIILARGEATGHAHVVESAEAWGSGVEVETIRTLKGQPAIHPEHAPIPLVVGHYRITRQREYSPAEIRRVAD